MAESKEKLKSLLMQVKVKSEKAGSKLNIQKTNIVASGSITSWQINGETMGLGDYYGHLKSCKFCSEQRNYKLNKLNC